MLETTVRLVQLFSKLPASAMVSEYSIDGYNLTIHYGIKSGSNVTQKDFEEHWLTDKKYEKIIVGNSISLLILIQNAEKVTLDVKDIDVSFSITRKRSGKIF